MEREAAGHLPPPAAAAATTRSGNNVSSPAGESSMLLLPLDLVLVSSSLLVPDLFVVLCLYCYLPCFSVVSWMVDFVSEGDWGFCISPWRIHTCDMS